LAAQSLPFARHGSCLETGTNPPKLKYLRSYYKNRFHATTQSGSGKPVGNRKAFELAKKNIALHAEGKPTVDGRARIVEIALRDNDPKNPGENALLSAWLIFPYACDEPLDDQFNKVPVKKRYLAGFHLFLHFPSLSHNSS
jgi:hypothetical protein